jgi:hypothetical protein
MGVGILLLILADLGVRLLRIEQKISACGEPQANGNAGL